MYRTIHKYLMKYITRRNVVKDQEKNDFLLIHLDKELIGRDDMLPK